jgi:hypothetical protein
MKKKLDYLKMLKAIDKLVNTDFCEDMSWKSSDESANPITQKDAKQMAGLLGRVYSISHAIHCEACGQKWRVNL